ncbi:hypothetical protein Tco_1277409 [Tanacetum coccineum]
MNLGKRDWRRFEEEREIEVGENEESNERESEKMIQKERVFKWEELGRAEEDAVTLLKRIRKFSVAQDIGARAAIHIFSMISFAIAREVRAQIVSLLPSNLL